MEMMQYSEKVRSELYYKVKGFSFWYGRGNEFSRFIGTVRDVFTQMKDYIYIFFVLLIIRIKPTILFDCIKKQIESKRERKHYVYNKWIHEYNSIPKKHSYFYAQNNIENIYIYRNDSTKFVLTHKR